MAETQDLQGIFIDVEVSDEIRDDTELGRQARGGLPRRHLRCQGE